MSTDRVLADLRTRLLAGSSLFFLKSWEEQRWEQALGELALELERGLVTWTATEGFFPPLRSEDPPQTDSADVIQAIDDFPTDHLFLLKDFHPYLNEPWLVRRLRDRLTAWSEDRKTVLLLDPVGQVPIELSKEALPLDLPLPDDDDLTRRLQSLLVDSWADGLELTEEDHDRLVKGALGLTEVEAVRAWRMVLQSLASESHVGPLPDEVLTQLIAEKRVLAAGSKLIDFYDLEAGLADVGGLDELKSWLAGRALAYTSRAREQGVPRPRGVLLLGVQGCGKSLSARVAARVLGFPLIRLDIANLLSSGRGESESNLRDVLRLIDSIAPAVLWLDEMEKGFAGAEGNDGADPVMSRLVGSFLTWLSDTRQPVFVVATANAVENLPPELLRRGRFDELFFIDLPNYYERQHILQIHLSKRGYRPDQFDVASLSDQTDGYSGAELEQVVATAVLDAFAAGRLLSADDLDQARRLTVPLSITAEEKVFALRQWAQDRCRRATPDSRVTRLVDEEAREQAETLPVVPERVVPVTDQPWAQLAQAGQLKAALVDYVREGSEVRMYDLQTAFQPYVQSTGDVGLAVRTNPNVVVATGLSAELAGWIAELVASRRLFFHPCDVSRHASSDRPRFPVLSELTEARVEQPVWLPCMLRGTPHRLSTGPLGRLARVRLKNT